MGLNVQPAVSREGLLTTSAVDNIDHKTFATMATTSFHGCSIFVFQHQDSSIVSD